MISASENSLPLIQGIDTGKGLVMTGGTAEGYRQVLSMFRRDADDRLQKLRFFLYEGMSGGDGKFPQKHLSSFVTQVHALKSASGAIGAAEISAEASELETAGNGNNLAYIQENLPCFVERLVELVKNIRAALESWDSPQKPGGLGALIQKFTGKKSYKNSSMKANISEYAPIFQRLKNALEAQNVSDIDQVMEELNKKSPDPQSKEVLEQISDQILMTEFKSAKKTIDEFLAGIESTASP